jgi:nucleotide sugar dehydrogenase
MKKIAVIGIGRLGLCLALNLERAGYNVLGIDTSQSYVDEINSKSYNSPEPMVNELLETSSNFKAQTELTSIFEDNIEVIFIVVPTPSLSYGGFDHSYIIQIADNLLKSRQQTLRRQIIINSTTMPGFCDELQKKMEDFNYEVIYNPEFIAQGSIIRDQLNPDQVLIGEGLKEAGDILESIYNRMCENKPVFCRMSRISAEITKLATNCFLTTKIAFANAIGDIAAKSGAEPEKILEAIGVDSRIGTKYFKYGFGYGGPCFPRDNKAFESFASGTDYSMLISRATDSANQQHADFLLKQHLEKYKPEETIVFDSVTYKKGTDILEESQQLKLALALAQAGRKVMVKENKAVIEALQVKYGNIFIYSQNEV